jgi:TRAP-type uncharacterized transport system substrate-binding protein
VGAAAILAVVSSGQVKAQDSALPKMLVAANSSSGTYLQMVEQIKTICADEFNVEIIDNKGGAVGNLEALVNNKAQAAFMHSDVLQASAIFDKKYEDYKTLLALYPEDIHVIVLRNSITKVGGVAGIGATTKEFSTLADLDNFKVGAAGGGVKTMQILKGQGGAGFTAVPYDKGDDLLPALKAGEIQAVIFVGGAPLPNVEKLSWSDYKLIPIGDSLAGRLKDVYRPTQLTYSNLRASQVSTLAPVATLVTRQYKTPKFVKMQAAFRNCFYSHLDEMKETPGLHPKWQEVQAWDHGVWKWLDLPGDQQPGEVLPK